MGLHGYKRHKLKNHDRTATFVKDWRPKHDPKKSRRRKDSVALRPGPIDEIVDRNPMRAFEVGGRE